MNSSGHAASAEAKENIRVAYARWNVPEKFTENEAVTTKETLSEILSTIEPRIPEMKCRVFPSTFEPKDPGLRAFPRAIHWRWDSCEGTLKFFGARVVMTRLPHFWQLESSIHTCCRNAGAPLFTNEPENMPVGAAAITSAGVDTIITEASDAFPFASFLSEKKIPLPALWFLIHKADASEWSTPAPLEHGGIHAVQEVHIFPGMPVLEQCPALAGKKKPLFHTSPAYAWDMQKDATYITSTGDEPLPLYRYLLPIILRETGMCECGKAIVGRKPQ